MTSEEHDKSADARIYVPSIHNIVAHGSRYGELIRCAGSKLDLPQNNGVGRLARFGYSIYQLRRTLRNRLYHGDGDRIPADHGAGFVRRWHIAQKLIRYIDRPFGERGGETDLPVQIGHDNAQINRGSSPHGGLQIPRHDMRAIVCSGEAVVDPDGSARRVDGFERAADNVRFVKLFPAGAAGISRRAEAELHALDGGGLVANIAVHGDPRNVHAGA